jgi:hypothetical protein
MSDHLAINLAQFFSQEELLFLKYHLQYAASRLESLVAPATMEQLAELVRDNRYFTCLAQAVAQALASPRLVLDLKMALISPLPFFRRFLTRELQRSQEAIIYLQNQPADPLALQDIVQSLVVESRLLALLLVELGDEETGALGDTLPLSGEEMLRLLFISLPKSMVTDPWPVKPGPKLLAPCSNGKEALL